MFETPFYNKHIRNLVSVFGTLFNDIKVQRVDGSGKILETNKVPLAYGPKQKFISRVQGQASLTDPKMAIKLPRMAFEISSIDYDTSSKLNKQIRDAYPHPDDSYKRRYLRTFAPYNVGFSLSILAKNMDEGLQIVEQILPLFQPDYTVTIIENNDVSRKTDIPFVLNSVDLAEDYEGDFASRRSIIYTLEFTTKLRFYHGISEGAIIKHVDVNMIDTSKTTPQILERINQDVLPSTASKDDVHKVIQTIDFFADQ
jgi:hypothetical protein